jgi:hypothetical protein
MSTCISILSEQLIPNVLFIKQMADTGNRHIFLSTEKMEADKKSNILADTLNLSLNQYKVVIIDPNRPADILEVLDEYSWPDGPYIVNITGGTKMMSQMVYLYFSEISNSRIYYWPIGNKSVELLHPTIEELPIHKAVLLNLSTYFAAHGYSYICQTELYKPLTVAQGLLKQTIASGSAGKVPALTKPHEVYFNPDEKVYFSGAWFEEWLYTFLKRELNLRDDAIGLNLKLKNIHASRPTESDNEVDVAFVYKNRLYIWECKVYNQIGHRSKKIADPVYKMSSISQSLGLQATSFVAILAMFGESQSRKDFLNDITRVMRIKKVFSMEDFFDTDLFLKELKILIDYGS